ncbi:hypothetical protein HPP92_008537 [Vanilla planifolia]|uniref:Uncharacterized protein n=1 Tax=Vanilla planifolia TaxID=51239 RepID=A0A835V5S2_VANPL|nr:hypothetical protein HPP92_008537 [Vanilla planifolia]
MDVHVQGGWMTRAWSLRYPATAQQPSSEARSFEPLLLHSILTFRPLAKFIELIDECTTEEEPEDLQNDPDLYDDRFLEDHSDFVKESTRAIAKDQTIPSQLFDH